MPNRPIQLLALAAALFVTGAGIVAVSGQHGGANPPVAQMAPPAAAAPMTLLPTVIVRPEPEIPTLAAITIRPSRTEREAAGLDAADEHPLKVASVRGSSSGLLPSGGFDMPYYSFGKTLHRVSKE